MSKDKPGRIERAIRRAVLGPVEGRRGLSDKEIADMIEEQQRKDGESK